MACACKFNFIDYVGSESVYADLLMGSNGKSDWFLEKNSAKNFPRHNKSHSLVKKPRKYFLTKSIIPW
jgi:hypothetical protein